MNSKPNNSVSLNNYEFDFDLGSNFSNNRSQQPLKDQKQPQPSQPQYAQPKPSSSTPWTPNKPSWTHQPAPTTQTVRSELLSPVSMVGDIHGKSWASKAPSNSSSSGVGIAQKNPNLFSDLLGSALGQNKSGSNVPLKNAAPAGTGTGTGSKSSGSFSMGNSLPKTGNTWGSGDSFGSFTSAESNKSGSIGGPSMKSGASGVGMAAAAKKDPFGSFVDFGSKKEGGIKSNANNKSSNGRSSDDHLFSNFQNAGKSSTPLFPSATKNVSVGGTAAHSSKKDSFGDFDIPIPDFQSQPQSKGVDPLDSLFASSASQVTSDATGNEPFSEMADWDVGADFGGSDVGNTTELEGLPPPPAGMTASSAKNKGLDSYKQGQHADAIKWLSWAVVLLEKAADNGATMEVLSCRASCYKEVGEYKKAIADCTKVLEQDDSNVSVLIQRALLYESTEKYKLGAEDLRTVMKIDPSNRLARSTIHRLLQMAG